MKTYILSVNTLMWNLTSERHDNYAPCLGLILPIWWVTPPPTFLEDFSLASWLHYLLNWFLFKVYLQSMKTCIRSVHTLMRYVTWESHDNCASCLGLILPIRWVTPPPNSSVWSVLPMALHLLCLHILFVFILNLSSWLSSLCWFDCLFHIYTSVLSSTTFTYSYVFLLNLLN